MSEGWLRRHPKLSLMVPLSLGLFVRLLGIVSRPIWYDEAFAILFAEKGLHSMLIGTLTATGAGSADIHPLGYYTVLWTWMSLFGESLVSTRGLSILASVAALGAAYALALEVFGRKTALAAGILVALSPFNVHYGQEIRMYAFLSLWLVLATYCYWRGSQSSGGSWWIGFAIFAALAQYTHNLAAFYLLALALWPVLSGDRRSARGTLLAGCLAIILCLPWLLQVPAQFAKVAQAYWIERPSAYRLLTLLLAFVTNLPVPDPWLGVALFCSLAVVGVALWKTVEAARQRREDLQQGLWVLYMAFVPPALLFVFSQWRPVYVERALLPSGVMFLIWVAWTTISVRAPNSGRVVLGVLIAVAFGLGLYQHLTYTGFPYAPYGALTAYLEAQRQPGDIIVHSNKLSVLPSVYYDRGLAQTYLADPPGSATDTLAPSTQRVLGLVAQPGIGQATKGANRVWYIIFDESIREYAKAGIGIHPDIAWLTAHYAPMKTQQWGSLRVYLFSRSP